MSDTEKEALKELALSIVRVQSNTFIKELLREHKVRIGATKADFDANLIKAIEAGVITREHIESWLNAVEGWGQQHVYVYRLGQDVKAQFATRTAARQAIEDAELGDYWDRSTTGVVDWPEDESFHLVAITYDDSLRFHWHTGAQYWIRGRDEAQHDKPNEWIDGFEYQFRAYRGRAVREVMRFEIRPQDAMAALFVASPIKTAEHEAALATAMETVQSVFDFELLRSKPLLVSKVIRNFDQALTFGTAGVAATPSTTRLKSGAAYVEFGATVTDGSYFDSPDVKVVREVIRSEQTVGAFDGTSAAFRFGDFGRVELSAGDFRIRLWSSLTADSVWHILRTLYRFQTNPRNTPKAANDGGS